MDLFQASLAKLENRLLDFGTELALAMERGRGRVSAEYRQTVDDLRWKHLFAQVQLDHLRAAGPEQWAALRLDIEELCHEMEISFERLPPHDTSITIPCSTA